jgi:hypothetical protein
LTAFARPIREAPNDWERLIAAAEHFLYHDIAEENRPEGERFLERQIGPAALKLAGYILSLERLIKR